MASIGFKVDAGAPDSRWALGVLRARFGIDGTLEELPGELDLNYAVLQDGVRTHVLKVMRPGCERALVDLQIRALQHAVEADPSLPLPVVVPGRLGETCVEVEAAAGEARLVWLITALSGRLYAEVSPQPPALAAAAGSALGRLAWSLRTFGHPGLVRTSKWDLAGAGWILDHLEAIPEGPRRRLIDGIGRDFVARLKPALAALPVYAIHNDLNDYNLLVDLDEAGSPRISGIFDFGDTMLGARVSDIAIGAAYAILGQARPIETLAAFVAGYHAVWSLSEAELALLYPLVKTRLAVSVTNSGLGKLARPEDGYVTVSEQGAWAFLDQVEHFPDDWVETCLRVACGYPGHPSSTSLATFLADPVTRLHPVLPVALDRAPILDLAIDGAGSPDDPMRFDLGALAAHVAAIQGEWVATVGRYAEPRLIYTAPAFRREFPTGAVRRTVHMGLDVFVPAGTPVSAPVAAIVVDVAYRAEALDYGGVVTLAHRTPEGAPFYTLYGHLARDVIDRLRPGQAIAAGERFALVGAPAENGGWPAHLHLQLGVTTLGRGCDWPGVVDPDDLATWRILYPNPARLLGLDPVRLDAEPRSDEARVQERRMRFAHNLKTSYREPLTAVRGSRHFLYDPYGREYLDVYNNVPHVGHCHPRLVRVLREQARLLNTNTRYLHEAHLAYGHALAARFPAPLEVCFFVNSGSEANELAIRLARTCTGNVDTVVLEDGYHGNTNTAIAISHYKFGGKGGKGQEPWVQVAALPDGYRGRYRAGDLATLYADDVRARLAAIAARGQAPAAFICETYPSVGGQIVLPEGYLRQVYASVRQAGGLCIADEVQTGFGRLGETFWGFEAQGVVPDIVVLGKPIGNGYPIGAVVTTRAIADRFANGMEFFSTFGGSTVACAVGREVLRIIDDEQLPRRVSRVGAYLRRGLDEFAQHFDAIGDIRGAGLFLGIELVTDRTARSPATQLTERIVNRLRELRVLVGTEGRDNSVIKIRPPLSFDEAAADRFLACLSMALSESAGAS